MRVHLRPRSSFLRAAIDLMLRTAKAQGREETHAATHVDVRGRTASSRWKSLLNKPPADDAVKDSTSRTLVKERAHGLAQFSPCRQAVLYKGSVDVCNVMVSFCVSSGFTRLNELHQRRSENITSDSAKPLVRVSAASGHASFGSGQTRWRGDAIKPHHLNMVACTAGEQPLPANFAVYSPLTRTLATLEAPNKQFWTVREYFDAVATAGVAAQDATYEGLRKRNADYESSSKAGRAHARQGATPEERAARLVQSWVRGGQIRKSMRRSMEEYEIVWGRADAVLEMEF